MSENNLRLSQLFIHPIKSCGGIAVDEAPLIETGFEYDREWMVVDQHGGLVTQRELPRMALIQPTLRASDLVLRAPGMLALHLQLDAVEGDCRVRVWDDTVDAYDMGDLAAQWFSDFLGQPLRLARFNPDVQRLASAQWTGTIEARTAFSDQFPLLVISTASWRRLHRHADLGVGRRPGRVEARPALQPLHGSRHRSDHRRAGPRRHRHDECLPGQRARRRCAVVRAERGDRLRHRPPFARRCERARRNRVLR
jgi:uncharacterized protein YcbX